MSYQTGFAERNSIHNIVLLLILHLGHQHLRVTLTHFRCVADVRVLEFHVLCHGALSAIRLLALAHRTDILSLYLVSAPPMPLLLLFL